MPPSSILALLLLTPWLIALCVSDVLHRRLPNALTLGGLAAALAWQAGWGGVAGLWDGVAAAGVCVLFLLPPFLVRAAGAGDLKMLAACGAFLGWHRLFLFLVATSFAGLAVAVAMLVLRQASAPRMKHFFRCVFDWRYDRAAGRAALPPRDDEKTRIPFGVAIALGAWATIIMEVFA